MFILRGKFTVTRVALSLSVFLITVAPLSGEQRSIRSVDFKAYLIKRDHLDKFLDCEGPSIQRLNVTYVKLLPGGSEQAVVEAASCAMGNGGADIVEVFNLDESGKIVSLPFDDSGYREGELYEGQRWTPRLQVIKGKLVRWYILYDKSSTGEPKLGYKREIFYEWSGDRFIIERVADTAP